MERQKCDRSGVASIVDWIIQWLCTRQSMNLSLLLQPAKPYMMSRSMPNGSVLASYIDLGEIVLKHTSCFKLSQVDVYEAVMELDSRKGYSCLGVHRCKDGRVNSTIFRRVLDWYRWMRTEPQKRQTGIRSVQGAGLTVKRLLALVDKLDAPPTSLAIVPYEGGGELATTASMDSKLARTPSMDSMKSGGSTGCDNLLDLLDEAVNPRGLVDTTGAATARGSAIVVLTPSRTDSFLDAATRMVEHTPVKVIRFDALEVLSPWRSDSFLVAATKKAQDCAQTPLRGVKGHLQRAITTSRKQQGAVAKGGKDSEGAVAKGGKDKTTHKGAVAKGGKDKTTHKGAVAKGGKDSDTHKGGVAKGGKDSDTHKGGVATGEKDNSWERKKRKCRARTAAMSVARAEGKDIDEVFRLGRISYNAEQ